MGVIYVVREAFHRALTYRGRRERGAPEDPEAETLLQVLDGKLPVHWVARAEKDIRAALRLAEEFSIPKSVILEGHEAGDVASELKARNLPVLVGPIFHPQARSGGRRFNEDFPLPSGPEEIDPHDHATDPALFLRRLEREQRGIDVPLNPEEEAFFAGEHDCCAVQDAGLPQVEERPPSFTAAALWQAGVPAAFAYGGTEPGETLLDFARFAVRSGLAPSRAIPMITLEAAKILGCADRVGSIEAGKDADLVAFDGDPLAPASAVRLVIVDGRVAFDAMAPALAATP
jgi:hypothetical protein